MDINLSFENAKKNGNLKNIVIVEVKQERMNRSSDFMRIAKENLFRTGFALCL